jgi:hypothetical protein
MNSLKIFTLGVLNSPGAFTLAWAFNDMDLRALGVSVEW